MSVSKTKQLQKETLEYGQKRLLESPFQKYVEKNQDLKKPVK